MPDIARWLLLALAAAATRSPAQCTNPWVATGGFPGVQTSLSEAHAWDPDGAGPQPVRLVVGGAMTSAGGLPVARVAAWDPATASNRRVKPTWKRGARSRSWRDATTRPDGCAAGAA